MNEKCNKNAKVEKLTKKVGRGVGLTVIGPFLLVHPAMYSMCCARSLPTVVRESVLRIPSVS